MSTEFLERKYCAGSLVPDAVVEEVRNNELERRRSVAQAKADGTYTVPIFSYKKCCELDGETECVKAVRFSISRYGRCNTKIVFNRPVTVAYAVGRAEKWLSQPFTREIYERVKDDLYCAHEGWSYEALQAWGWEIRGQCLGADTYLEGTKTDAQGVLTFVTGS